MTVIESGQVAVVYDHFTGAQIAQFLPNQIDSITWSRETKEISRCEISAPVTDITPLPGDLTPWRHWVSVWDSSGEQMFWRGPVTRIEGSRSNLSISAKDPSAYLAKTRCGVTKQWEVADPAFIAADLWFEAAEKHRLDKKPVIKSDPFSDKIDHSVIANMEMLDATFSNLISRGLTWFCVAGRMCFGPMSRTPVTSLGEEHFLEDLTIVRDGADQVSDFILRTSGEIVRAKLGNSGLEGYMMYDKVSSAENAAREYVKWASQTRSIVLPENSTLHPDADITIDQLVPTARFVLDALGVLAVVQLNKIEVTERDGRLDIAVGLESIVDDEPELIGVSSNAA